MNPILSREVRVRFRDKRSFWLLFGLVALLCLAAGWIYSTVAHVDDTSLYGGPRFGYGSPYGSPYGYSYGNNAYVGSNPSLSPVAQRASQTGRALFQILAMGNVLAWLLIAPALTATGLAKERERGLLESLWLSPFQVRSQIAGRMGAVLFFLLILQVAVLPVYGIALLLGGVSPQEIGMAGLIIALTAISGSALGMWCSARSYRSANALGSVFVIVAAWSFFIYNCVRDLTYGITPSGLSGNIGLALSFQHPVAQMTLLLFPESFRRFGARLMFQPEIAFALGMCFQLLITAALLWGATRQAGKALPDMRWREGNKYIKDWKVKLEAAKKEREERRERQRASEKLAGAMLHELPVEKLVRFKDPILAREIRGRFRLRQSGLLVNMGRWAVFLFLASFWLYVFFLSFDFTSRTTTGGVLLNGLLGFGILAVGVMSSTSLVREREGGTWEGLHLSLMQPLPMIRSKWLSPLITFAYWSAPLWILLPLCSRWNGKDGLDFLAMTIAVVIIWAALGAVSAWGMWISGRAPHSAAATSWTLGTLLIFLFGLPWIDAIFNISNKLAFWMLGSQSRGLSSVYYSNYYGGYYPENEFGFTRLLTFLQSYNPFIALQSLLAQYSRQNYYGGSSYYGRNFVDPSLLVTSHLLFCGLIVAILLWRVVKRVNKIES
jgi:hypothetical protein